jgi:hypothetical protein
MGEGEGGQRLHADESSWLIRIREAPPDGLGADAAGFSLASAGLGTLTGFTAAWVSVSVNRMREAPPAVRGAEELVSADDTSRGIGSAAAAGD